MEGWGKIGVQSASVLYPNSCYNESCYIEVQVYYLQVNDLENEIKVTKNISALKLLTMIYLCKFGENPSTGSKDIPFTRLRV